MRVGIIGAGYIGEKHAQALAEIAEIDLVAASRTDAGALTEFVDRYGGNPYRDYRDLLADPQVDAVLIATPHDSHASMSIAAAEAGKHILLEKPMATSLADCDAILAAVAEHGVTLMVGHVTRFSKAFQIAKALLEGGELGEVVLGSTTMRKRWHEPNRRDWHLDRAQGGGVLLTGGVHAIDRIGWLIGANVTSVSARLATRFHDQPADDCGLLFLRYANGAVATVASVGYRTGAPEHGTELTCTNGILRVHSVAGVQIGRDESWEQVPDSGSGSWMDEALELQWQEFARAVATGTEPAISGGDARQVMAALFAAEASSEQGREIVVAGG